MTNVPHLTPLPPETPTEKGEIGYGKPPKHNQFKKGVSGNPSGRPKKSTWGINLKAILDGEQLGKNGESVTRREAVMLKLVQDALAGKPKAFSKFITLLDDCGLLKREDPFSINAVPIEVGFRTQTVEEFERNFGRPMTDSEKRNLS